jgi:hypothetical protein
MSLVSNWYVLGTGTVDGQMFAQYAEEPKQGHNAAAVMGKPILPAGSNKGNWQRTFSSSHFSVLSGSPFRCAEAADWARRMHRRGIVGELRINWKELIAFKRTFTDPVPKNREESFAKQGIDAFHGTAHFGGPDTVIVEGRALKGRNIVIAGGARPVPLNFPGAPRGRSGVRWEENISMSSNVRALEEIRPLRARVGPAMIQNGKVWSRLQRAWHARSKSFLSATPRTQSNTCKKRLIKRRWTL